MKDETDKNLSNAKTEVAKTKGELDSKTGKIKAFSQTKQILESEIKKKNEDIRKLSEIFSRKIKETENKLKLVKIEADNLAKSSDCSICMTPLHGFNLKREMKEEERISIGFTFINTQHVKEIMLECTHTFHLDCILRTFERNDQCPCCRGQINEESIDKMTIISEYNRI